MPRQPDDAHVVAEVLAAELRADPDLPGDLQDGLLELQVPEPVGKVIRGRQRVQVARQGVLGGLQRVLRAGAADHDRQVVRRAGGGTDGADLLLEERGHPGRVQHRLRLLVQVRLVRGTAALGHEQELVRVAVGGVELNLGRRLDPVFFSSHMVSGAICE